jgi:hypothetical protein
MAQRRKNDWGIRETGQQWQYSDFAQQNER